MISFFIAIIKKICFALLKAGFYFGKGVIIAFKKYTVQSLLFLFALICALLTVRHCKYGIFIGCKDTTIHNNFKKPCKIYQEFSGPVYIKEKKTKEIKNILKKKTEIKDKRK